MLLENQRKTKIQIPNPTFWIYISFVSSKINNNRNDSDFDMLVHVCLIFPVIPLMECRFHMSE